MKNKELRIGNWVTYKPYGNRDGEPVKIAGMLGMQAYFNKYTNDAGLFHNLVEIPLTPELLEKAGFTYEGERDGQSTYTKWEDVSCFRITKGAGIGNYYYIPCYPTIQVRNLHQLQNLYFALMEQELEINL